MWRALSTPRRTARSKHHGNFGPQHRAASRVLKSRSGKGLSDRAEKRPDSTRRRERLGQSARFLLAATANRAAMTCSSDSPGGQQGSTTHFLSRDSSENPRTTKGRIVTKKLLCSALIFVPLALAGCAHKTVVVYNPPPAYSEAAQHGYRQGVQAAQNDIRNGLGPDVDRHPRFRNPPVPPPLQEDYRHGFRDGYQAVFHGARPGY